MTIIPVALLYILQLLYFYLFGNLLLKCFKLQTDSITLPFIIGFGGFFAFFGLYAIPVTILCLPLSYLSTIMAAFILVSILLYFILCRKDFVLLPIRVFHTLRNHWIACLLFLSVILLQMIIVFTHIDGSADSAYYIGKISTNVYTNTLGQYNPYTGSLNNALDSRRIFACYPDYSSVICQLFGIHPLKQAKLIMPELIILFTNIIYYHIGLLLFENNKRKATCVNCMIFLLNFYNNTIYTSATFLFTRSYEGKSILANFVIPGLLLSLLLLWKDKKSKLGYCMLFIFSISSCIFSSSSMLIIPVGLTAGLIPLCLKEKSRKIFYIYLLSILPNVLVCVSYWLSHAGLLVFKIH